MSEATLRPAMSWRAPFTWLSLVLLVVAYYGAARIGLLFALSDTVASPIWPPAGLAIAAVVILGRRALPAVAVGAFLVNWTAGIPPMWSLLMAVGNTAEAALGGWLIARAGGQRVFDTLGGLPRFGGAAMLAAIPAATLGMASLLGAGIVPLAGAPEVWWTWYLGDLAGAAVIAPVVLLAVGRKARWPTLPQAIERMGASVALAGAALVVFGLFTAPLSFLVVLPLVWIALRFGPLPTAVSLLALDAAAVLATGSGRGPFVAASTNASFLLLQAYILTVSFLCLALSALSTERRRSAHDLEERVIERTTRLQAEVEERRRAELQVIEAQRIARMGTWRWDITKPNAVWSPELYRIYALDPTTHVPTYEDYLTRVHPDDVERVKVATEAVFKDQKPYSHDERIRRPDGSWRDLHTWAQAVTDDSGKLVALVGTCQDITERKDAERALAESAERLRALAEASPIGIVRTTPQGSIDYANRAWVHITGILDYRNDDAVRKAIHPEDQPKSWELWGKALAEGREFVADMRWVHPDGAVRLTSCRAVPTRDGSGAITGFVSTVEDVTDQRAAEAKDHEVRRLREQAEFKTNFLRTAAHELGTPLTPIKIQMRILRDLLKAPDRQGGEGERKAAEILERNISRLHVLVQDMLESARLQSGRLKLAVRPMDMAQVVHEVVETFQDPAIQTGVVLDTQGPHEMPMVGDPDRLSQVLYNLLSNAMKFTPAGGQIHVRLAVEDPDTVRVTVQDNGAGFAPDQAAQLFQPFSQLHDPMQKTRNGSGLGLYISRGIVEEHGGHMACESAGPGKGATFSFAVPRVTVSLELPPSPGEALAAQVPAAQRRTPAD